MSPLPEGLISILRECCGFFENDGIKYWLGGGLFQCIKEGRFDEIRQSWDKKEHDIDFYVMASDISRIKACASDLGYEMVSDVSYKLALKKNGHSIEFIYIFSAPTDDRVVYFLGWGKKELWRASGLPEKLRQRLYRHSLPTEVFGNDNMTIDGLNLRVPTDIYLKILYPSYVVSSMDSC